MAIPRDFAGAGAPGGGTTAVHTLTIGGTPTGGTFKLKHRGQLTGAITWSATNATLLANIDAALEALRSVGTGGITTAAGTLTAGVGTVTLTFAGANVSRSQPVIEVGSNDLTGTAPTLAVAETTAGVDATGLNAAVGDRYTDRTNGKLYIASAVTSGVPTWTVVGSQS